jgi:hypothetical protein
MDIACLSQALDLPKVSAAYNRDGYLFEKAEEKRPLVSPSGVMRPAPRAGWSLPSIGEKPVFVLVLAVEKYR